jgi:hypothetical protein
MRHDSKLVDQDDPSDWHRDLVDETLEKPTKSKPIARRAKRGKGGGQHVEEEVDSRGDVGGREEKEDDPHEEPLRAFMDSDFFKQGRWKLAAPDAVAYEPAPPSPKPKAKPRAKAKSRAKPARVPPVVVEEEEEGGPYEEPSGLTSSFYDTMIIV